MTGKSNKTVNRIIQAYRKKAASATLHINGTLVQRLLLRTPTSSTPRRQAPSVLPERSVRPLECLQARNNKTTASGRKPRLSLPNKTARLNFAKELVSWTTDASKTVLFSDESTFTTRWHQKQRVWRPAMPASTPSTCKK
ncbi:hypothetical protein HPB50_002651 [Hyalomma asiaticum]|uniref:Uncharacterized protein n=1 Tax=Hyalomma asiaticum TaxID=266040 RepID=A0ACB7TBI0_HYAAI|nr:hypothetical protein HPB50_002651 [Hyalomma asiaticum]